MAKRLVLPLMVALLMHCHSQAATIIAGLDTWDSATAPTVPVTAPGVTATATASGVGGNWSNTEGSGRGSSKDTTWGTFDGNGNAADATTDGSNLNFTLTNGKTDGEVTLTITNNGPDDLALENVHFDAVAFRPNAARTWAVNVLAGSDITVGNVYTSGLPMNDNSTDAITQLGGNLLTDDSDPLTHDQHDDIDLPLTGLADNVLEVGGTAIIQVAFSNGTGSGSGHHLFLDNVAISGSVSVIPEPSSCLLALLGMASMAALGRRAVCMK
jgi:hypothetical protein